MFSKIRAVAMRDFNAVVRTKGFIIGICFMPAMILASSWIPRLLERYGERGDRRFAVADFSGRIGAPLAAELAERSAGEKLKAVAETVDLAARGAAADDFAAVSPRLRTELDERVRKNELFGYVIVGPRAVDVPESADPAPRWPGGEEGAGDGEMKPTAIVYGATSLTTGDLRGTVRDSVNECVRRARLLDAGVDPSLMRRIDRRPEFEERVVGRTEGGPTSERSSGVREGAVPIGIMILMMMGIMQSAGTLLQATIEEKSNRVVEVLMSSVRPFELLAGKILGAWLVGLVVLLAWGGAAAIAAERFNLLRAGVFSPTNVAWYLFFFVGGYLVYASLYGAIGAMCSSIQDAQSMMLPIMLLIMIPMFGMSHVVEHPDSSITLALTFFPFSGPMIMPMRLAQLPPPPTWQLAGAAATLAVAVVLLMWLGAKIFRTAILMTGKPPKPSELWRMLREA